MPKISELTVADLRGARDQIEAHLRDRLGLSFWSHSGPTFRVSASGVNFALYLTRSQVGGEEISVHEYTEHDADWSEFMDLVWKRVGQIPSREVRDLRSVMAKLGDAIEGLADSPSEFAVTLTARLKALRDEAGARLIEHQPAE